MFSPLEVSDFRFFQFNAGNAQYFLNENSFPIIRICDTPHFAVANLSRSGDREKIAQAKSNYLEYLKFSWPSYDFEISPAALEEKYQRYLEHIEKVARAGELSEPVLITQILAQMLIMSSTGIIGVPFPPPSVCRYGQRGWILRPLLISSCG